MAAESRVFGCQPEEAEGEGGGFPGDVDEGAMSGLQSEDVCEGSAQDGGDGSAVGDQREKRGSGMEQAGGTVREAGGDGGQAGGAGSPVPVEFQRTGRYMWQVHLGYDKWQDVDPTWAEPLAQALRDGVRTIRLWHSYQNKFGEANTRSTM